MIMTKATQPLTIEDMNEILYTRAEEVFLLCMLITRRGLAHAFCNFSGHVEMLESKVQPTDSCYAVGSRTQHVAELQVWFDLSDREWADRGWEKEEFEKKLAELDTYVSYLDYIIARNEPVTTSNMAA